MNLHGSFCSGCGQRAVVAYPTVKEMIGDAWEELSGYDGRIARTLRLLLKHPGTLTVEHLEGRRVRYVSPVRLYLLASLAYFLCAVLVPNVRVPEAAVMPGSDVKIQMDGSGRLTGLSAEGREQALESLTRAPWWAQRMIGPVLRDPEGFRSRFLQTLPRVLFAIVPIFALIVGMFYRGRRFAQHLVFAVHFHAAVFVILTIRELSQLAGSRVILATFDVASVLAIISYALLSFRRVYRELWPRAAAKAAGIAVIYALVGVCALVITMMWSTWWT
jgi:hypothetical protein